jgi:hypothetical protein
MSIWVTPIMAGLNILDRPGHHSMTICVHACLYAHDTLMLMVDACFLRTYLVLSPSWDNKVCIKSPIFFCQSEGVLPYYGPERVTRRSLLLDWSQWWYVTSKIFDIKHWSHLNHTIASKNKIQTVKSPNKWKQKMKYLMTHNPVKEVYT